MRRGGGITPPVKLVIQPFESASIRSNVRNEIGTLRINIVVGKIEFSTPPEMKSKMASD